MALPTWYDICISLRQESLKKNVNNNSYEKVEFRISYATFSCAELGFVNPKTMGRNPI